MLSNGSLVDRGQEPFQIKSIECDDPRFAFRVDDETKSVHLVLVTFTAGTEPGQVSNTLRIATDLPSNGRPEATVQAIVAPAQADRAVPPR
ncbi:MAG: hypothetical protein U1E05_10210 [Patescibacteria group bacterium]|nr:hypothetical protein [Patescibacteria group bacterium]